MLIADMQLISKFDKGTRFLQCVIDVFSKHAWVVPLKGKKGITIVKVFQKVLDKILDEILDEKAKQNMGR